MGETTMRGVRILAVLAVGLLALGALWTAGPPAPARAQETGMIAGWVYWGTSPYAYATGAAGAEPPPGAVPPGKPAERGDVEPGSELPPAPPPPGGAVPPNTAQAPAGSQAPRGAQWGGCPPYYYDWPMPVQGALVAVQGTGLAATTDADGWFMIEGVPLG